MQKKTQNKNQKLKLPENYKRKGQKSTSAGALIKQNYGCELYLLK